MGGVQSGQALLTDTDYENMTIQWNDCDDYEIIRKVPASSPRRLVLVLYTCTSVCFFLQQTQDVCVCVCALWEHWQR